MNIHTHTPVKLFFDTLKLLSTRPQYISVGLGLLRGDRHHLCPLEEKGPPTVMPEAPSLQVVPHEWTVSMDVEQNMTKFGLLACCT